MKHNLGLLKTGGHRRQYSQSTVHSTQTQQAPMPAPPSALHYSVTSCPRHREQLTVDVAPERTEVL